MAERGVGVVRPPTRRGRMRSGFPIGALVALALAGLPQGSAAREAAAASPPPAAEPEAPPIEEIVITATRQREPAFRVPYTLQVLSEHDLQIRTLARTTPEALAQLPGIMVQKTSHGQGSPFIRGFTGFRTLFLIDGIRLNNSVFRDGPNQYSSTVDAFGLERMEVLKGPSSVLYGSDAIGGTVDALTGGPRSCEEERCLQGRLYFRYANAEASRLGRAELGGWATPDLGLLLGITRKSFGDLRAGRDVGRQPKTGYDEWDWDLKLEYHPTDRASIVFAHQQVDQNDAWRSHKTTAGISWEGTTIGKEKKRSLDQSRDLTYLQLHLQDLDGFVDAVHTSVSFQKQTERRDRIRKDDRSDRQGFDAGTYGSWLQLESESPFGRWIYGAEYYRDQVDSFKTKYKADGSLDKKEIQGPVADDASYDLLGVFGEDRVALGDRLALTLGGRFDYARAVADAVKHPVTGKKTSISDSWRTLVGSARAVFKLDREDRWNLFGGVSQGFRAPNLSDLTRLDTARTDEIETPAPGLDPEHFVSYEVGTKARFGGTSLQLAYFYTDIRDMIVRAPTGNVVEGDQEITKKNAGDGHVQGVELQGTVHLLPELSAFGSFAWTAGEVETFPTSAPVTETEPLDRLMPPTGMLGLRWEDLQGRYWLEGTVTLARRQSRLSTRDERDTQRIPPGGTPGYAVLTLRSGWEIREGITLSAILENLTDEDYRIHGSGQNEAGRNFMLGLDLRF